MNKRVEQFKNLGFIVVKNLIPKDEAASLYQYTLEKIPQGNLNDGQVPGSPSFYQDKEIAKLQRSLQPKIEQYIDKKLLTIFCYYRVYRNGAVLRMHKDSMRAEISVTVNLGQKGNPWPLWLVDYNENTHSLNLEPGDGLIYFGNKLHHWRGKLEDSDYVSQIMFHFATKSFKNRYIVAAESIRKIRKYCKDSIGMK